MDLKCSPPHRHSGILRRMVSENTDELIRTFLGMCSITASDEGFQISLTVFGFLI